MSLKRTLLDLVHTRIRVHAVQDAVKDVVPSFDRT